MDRHLSWFRKSIIQPSSIHKLSLAALLFSTCVIGCSDPDPVSSIAPTLERPPIRLPGPRPEDNPFLDDRQRAELIKLREMSRAGLYGEIFDRAGTVRRLELAVPAPAGRTLGEQAKSFVLQHGTLWKLSARTSLIVVSENTDGDCSTVVLQLVHSSGLPVWNALLTVTLGESGMVYSVSGSLSGAPFEASLESRVDARQASSILERHLGERGSLPTPYEAILDPFFYGDESHAAQRAWLFVPPVERGNPPVQIAAVGERTATVVFAGPVIARPAFGTCSGTDPTVLPVRVAIDPETELATFVDLMPLGGMEVGGGTPEARAIALLSRETMARIFGDTNPQAHLMKPRVRPSFGGRTTVTFEEHSNGRRVEGAYMQVVFNLQGNAETIFARYVYRPNVARSRNISLAAARVTGDAHYLKVTCAGDPVCEGHVAQRLAATPPPSEEVILSSRIFPTAAMPAKEERLAWRLEYDRRTLFVDAWTPTEGSAQILLDLPHERSAIPHTIHDSANNDRLEIVDGSTVPGVVPHPDSLDLRDRLTTMDTFFTKLRRNGWDGAGTTMAMRVQWAEDNAMFCPPPCTDMPEPGLYLGANLYAGDVVGHEFTHAITSATSNLEYTGESGALNESYSDVFGNLIFPDTTPGDWLVGEGTHIGTVRDMKKPQSFNQPGHVGLMDDSCMSDGCVHTWSGVPNRAAVLVSDGGVLSSAHAGLGRDTMAELYLDTLIVMGSTDRFVQQQLRTVNTCRGLASTGFADVHGRRLTPADCDFVVLAFREVGIDPQMFYSYQKFATAAYGGTWNFEEHTGEHLFNGCTLSDHVLWGQDKNGDTRIANGNDHWTLNFGEWSASITRRGADSDSTDRTVQYSISSNWYEAGVVRPIEMISRPPSIPRDEDCFYELPIIPPAITPHVRRLFSTTRVSHWSSFLDGGSGDVSVSPGALMPAGCTLVGLKGVEDHKTALQQGVVTTLDHGSHGFTISRPATALDPRGLSANVHWWHDGFSSIGVRVVYDVVEPDGADCSVANVTQDLP